MKLSFRRMASSIALAGLAGIAATACSAAPESDPGPVNEAPAKKIDAAVLESVSADQSLELDVSRPDVAYDIDYSVAPIDFSRIKLHFAPGHDVTMTDWLAQTAVGGRDTVSRNPGHFVIRPVSSSESPDLIKPTRPPGDGQCVTFCMWVCSSAEGPCTYECITNCP